jgi:hypothetical protein
VQVVKTLKHIKTPHHEQSTGDAERHQGATISNDLLRKVQLIVQRWFAFAYLTHERFGVSYFFAYRSRSSVPQPFHGYRSKGSEHQRQRKGMYGQITKSALIFLPVAHGFIILLLSSVVELSITHLKYWRTPLNATPPIT